MKVEGDEPNLNKNVNDLNKRLEDGVDNQILVKEKIQVILYSKQISESSP